MRLRALFLFGLVGLSGCETAEDPQPVSTFLPEEAFHRQILGRVRQGTEPVEGALIHIDPSPGFEFDDGGTFARSASTDAVGAYRVQYGPLQYDLSVRRDREVFVFQGVSVRYFEPPLGADAPIRAFKARVVPTTNPPPKAGNAVAYFVSGADAAAIAGEPGSLEASFRRFDTSITLHAVEYVASDGLVNAVAQGRTLIRVREGSAVSPIVAMTPITTRLEVVFDATPPADYALAPLEVVMDLGVRTSSQPVTRIAPGVVIQLGIVADARYTVRGRATKGGAVSDSGRGLFNSYDRKIAVILPPPVLAESPIDDSAPPISPPTEGLSPVTLDPGGVVSARITTGSIEHAFVPVAGDGPSFRVATEARATKLPDVTRLGLPRPVGRYTWTMEHFATLPHIDNLTGVNGRVVPPSWKSEPRVILLR